MNNPDATVLECTITKNTSPRKCKDVCNEYEILVHFGEHLIYQKRPKDVESGTYFNLDPHLVARLYKNNPLIGEVFYVTLNRSCELTGTIETLCFDVPIQIVNPGDKYTLHETKLEYTEIMCPSSIDFTTLAENFSI